MTEPVYKSIKEIGRDKWTNALNNPNPFLNYSWLEALEDSQCINSPSSGCQSLIITQDDTHLITYKKTHSYGEYIFDWSWADAYAQQGLAYYPKLCSMVPYTPVTIPHFIGKNITEQSSMALLQQHDEHYLHSPACSAHFLFIQPHERDIFLHQNYCIRDSMQYHFFNRDYKNFDDFLKQLKSKKAREIRRERRFDEKITIERFHGDAIQTQHADFLAQVYFSTIHKKGSYAYLNHDFFKIIFREMKNNILFVQAKKNNVPLAGALYLYDKERLYGRYWGCLEEIPFLHFELCVYQGIEFCIEKGLQVFEAGAQGEHKVMRGFEPIKTYSAHKLKDVGFNHAIEQFILKEKAIVQTNIKYLESLLPFK